MALLACLANHSGARAAPPQQTAPVSALAELDRSRATVGDTIGLTITVRYESGVKVNADGIVDQVAPFEALAADPPADRGLPNGGGELKLHFRIAAYQTGPLTFPPLTVSYSANGTGGTVMTQAIPFTVDTVIPSGDKATDIRPLKPQLELPLPAVPSIRRALIVAAAVLLAMALAAVGWRIRRQATVPAVASIELVSPLEAEARAELDQIVAEDYLGQGDYQTHYAQLAACIRRYLTKRYGFPASALTTSQLTERMVRSGVGRWRARLVAGLLTECDAVHFAHYIPAPARSEADLQMAYEIVDLALSQETRAENARAEVGG